jgi:hypothetical protein
VRFARRERLASKGCVVVPKDGLEKPILAPQAVAQRQRSDIKIAAPR